MISLCVTTYNRTKLLYHAIVGVLSHPRVTEVIIVDDYSKESVYEEIRAFLEGMPNADKIKLFRNEENLGMGRNKAKAVELSTNEWCILFDSDNVMDLLYINSIPETLAPKVIYCPELASPQFDYRRFSATTIDKVNAPYLIDAPMMDCLFNTCNYLVNREKYLSVYEYNPEMKGTDTIWFNYLWLKAGNSFYVQPGMRYLHRVHSGSGFMADAEYNMKKAAEMKELIKSLQ